MTSYLAPEHRRETSRFGRPSARSGPPIDWRYAGDAVPAPSVGARFTLVTLLIAAIAVLIPFVTTSRVVASLDIVITLAFSAALVAFLVHGPSRGSTSRQPAWQNRSRGSGDSRRTDASGV